MQTRELGVSTKTDPLIPAGPDREALFEYGRSALRFALNFTHGSLKETFLARAMKGGGRPGRGLAGLDGAAQAGMIKQLLHLLDPVRRDFIIARFTIPRSPCPCKAPCCSGYRETPDWGRAIESLTDFVLRAGLTKAISHHRLRKAVVIKYFGVRVRLVDVAEHCGVDSDTAGALNRRVKDRFRDEEALAEEAVHGHLLAAGIIEA
jgi:hypothetical protein